MRLTYETPAEFPLPASYNDKNTEDDADNNANNADSGSSSNSSSSSANGQHHSPSRMCSPEKDFIPIDGASDDDSSVEESAEEQRRGSKCAWPTDNASSNESGALPSTEPRNKKQRLQEPPSSTVAANNVPEKLTAEELRPLVNSTCNNLHKVNQGEPFADKDDFIP